MLEILKAMRGKQVLVGSYGLIGKLLDYKIEGAIWVFVDVQSGAGNSLNHRPTWLCMGPGMGIALIDELPDKETRD